MLFLFLCLAGLLSCSQATADSITQSEKIEVGPGPEDMVLDTLHGPRLLISCSARRAYDKPYGEIEALDLLTEERKILTRHREPDSLNFHPHGIYLDREDLYVISHEREPDFHPILHYRVRGDSLEFIELIHHQLLNSPNALVSGSHGELFVVNDAGKRGNMWEKILRLKRASLLSLKKDSTGLWAAAYLAIDLTYPAGINRIGKTIYAGDAIQNQLHVYGMGDHGLTPKAPIKGLKGNDNLRIYNGKILTCCHVKPMRFIGHAKNPDKLSPVEVFLIDPLSMEIQSLFANDGSQISGGSTAIIYDRHLYISQIFEPFLLKVALDL